MTQSDTSNSEEEYEQVVEEAGLPKQERVLRKRGRPSLKRKFEQLDPQAKPTEDDIHFEFRITQAIGKLMYAGGDALSPDRSSVLEVKLLIEFEIHTLVKKCLKKNTLALRDILLYMFERPDMLARLLQFSQNIKDASSISLSKFSEDRDASSSDFSIRVPKFDSYYEELCHTFDSLKMPVKSDKMLTFDDAINRRRRYNRVLRGKEILEELYADFEEARGVTLVCLHPMSSEKSMTERLSFAHWLKFPVNSSPCVFFVLHFIVKDVIFQHTEFACRHAFLFSGNANEYWTDRPLPSSAYKECLNLSARFLYGNDFIFGPRFRSKHDLRNENKKIKQ